MHIQAFFFLAGFGLLASIVSHVYVSAWLYSSGLYYLSQRLYYLSIYTIISFSICLFAGGIFILLKNVTSYYLFLMTAFLAFLTNFYFGSQLLYDPESFFISLTDVWVENLNSKQLNLIERKLKCCGFHRVGEYPKDKCKESYYTACFPAMKDAYLDKMKNGGFTYISISIMFILLIAFVLMHGTQKQTTSTRFPIERIGPVL